MAEAGELSGELGGLGRTRLATCAEIAAPEEIAGGDDSGSHRPIFVSALGPCQLTVDPQIEAHGPILAYSASSKRRTAVASSVLGKAWGSGTSRGKPRQEAERGIGARKRAARHRR